MPLTGPTNGHPRHFCPTRCARIAEICLRQRLPERRAKKKGLPESPISPYF